MMNQVNTEKNLNQKISVFDVVVMMYGYMGFLMATTEEKLLDLLEIGFLQKFYWVHCLQLKWIKLLKI